MVPKIIYLSIILVIAASCADVGVRTKSKTSTQESTVSINFQSTKPLPVFFTDQLIKNGIPIYFGFEEVDQDNIDFWKQYKFSSGNLANQLKLLPQRIKANTHKNSIKTAIKNLLSYDDSKYDSLVEFIKLHPKNQDKLDDDGSKNPQNNDLYQLFAGIDAGFAGMNVEDLHKRNRIYHVIYASSVPITRRHINADYVDTNTFEENFGTIVMSMAGITVAGICTTTHTGISRNPLDVLIGNKKYAGISMQLHGFGATIWLKYFHGKRYMITMPLESMANILKSKIDSRYIWLDDFPDEVKTLKNNGIDFDFSHSTPGSQKTTVDLDSLRAFWP